MIFSDGFICLSDSAATTGEDAIERSLIGQSHGPINFDYDWSDVFLDWPIKRQLMATMVVLFRNICTYRIKMQIFWPISLTERINLGESC